MVLVGLSRNWNNNTDRSRYTSILHGVERNVETLYSVASIVSEYDGGSRYALRSCVETNHIDGIGVRKPHKQASTRTHVSALMMLLAQIGR